MLEVLQPFDVVKNLHSHLSHPPHTAIIQERQIKCIMSHNIAIFLMFSSNNLSKYHSECP